MRFKHTTHVLIDNFHTTYKMLLYILVVALVSIGLGAAVVVPFLNSLGNDVNLYENFLDAISRLLSDIVNGEIDNLGNSITDVRDQFSGILTYLSENPSSIVLCISELAAVSLVSRFFLGLGNYAAGSVINDRMSMQTKSPFIGSLVKNLKNACIFNAIYAPLSIIYDALAVGLSGYLILFLLYNKAGVPILLALMLFVVAVIAFMAVKMTFTTDWLPAMICGKQSAIPAMKYSFSRRGKNGWAVFSFYVTSLVLIMGVNVLTALGTLGAGLLISLPLSYLYLLCYEFVNYCDTKEIKYFVDKRTIVKPEQEKALTREEFLRGDE